MGWFSQLTSGDIGGAFESAVGNVVSGVEDIAQSDLGKAAILAGGAYLAAPELFAGAAPAVAPSVASDIAAADVAGGLIPEYGTTAAYSATPGLEGFALPAAAGAGALTAEQLAQGSALTDAAAGAAGGAAAGSALSPAAAAAAGAAGGSALKDIMPYVAGGSLLSSYLGADAAKQAAQAQVDAANRASEVQKYIFDTINQQQAPYREAGYSALKNIQGQLPYLTSQYTPEDFAKGIDPGYAFRLKQGQMGVERAGNIRGMTGNVLTGLQDYSQGLASQEFANAFQRNLAQKQNIYNTLAGIAGIGQTSQGQTGQAAGTYGTNVANLMTGGAAAQAAGQIGQANALTSGINNALNTYTLASLLGQTGKVA